MSPLYNAKSRDDMRALAKALALAPRAARPAITANLIAEGVMIPRQWWVRTIMRFAKWRHKTDDFGAWAAVCVRAPQIADDFLEQGIDWIVNGKDAGGEGIGGLDQREVDIVTGMLLHLWRDEPSTDSPAQQTDEGIVA